MARNALLGFALLAALAGCSTAGDEADAQAAEAQLAALRAHNDSLRAAPAATASASATATVADTAGQQHAGRHHAGGRQRRGRHRLANGSRGWLTRSRRRGRSR